MFIYEITSHFYDEGMHDNSYDFDYLVHETEFTKQEFGKMCETGLEKLFIKMDMI